MKIVCKECGKMFDAEDHFSQFFAEPAKEPVEGICDECTERQLKGVEENGIGKEQYEREIELETIHCIIK